jgi:hypothetical protein
VTPPCFTMPEKVSEIIRNTTRPDFDAIEVGGKVTHFNGSGLISTTDHGAAAEVKARYGSEVVVIEKAENPPEPGRRRVFTVPQMPWKMEKPNADSV